MRNPLRKQAKQAPAPKKAAPTLRERALALISISDTDRMDRLVKCSGASREEIDAALRADRKFMRTKLLELRLSSSASSLYLWSPLDDYELVKEIDRILVEECAA